MRRIWTVNNIKLLRRHFVNMMFEDIVKYIFFSSNCLVMWNAYLSKYCERMMGCNTMKIIKKYQRFFIIFFNNSNFSLWKINFSEVHICHYYLRPFAILRVDSYFHRSRSLWFICQVIFRGTSVGQFFTTKRVLEAPTLMMVFVRAFIKTDLC